MGRFDEVYSFNLAKENDLDDIMSFYDKYWDGNKILARDKGFIRWMYGLPESDTICFILAREKKTHELSAVLGFVPLSPRLEGADIFGAGLQTGGKALPMLGTELDKRLTDIVAYRTYHSVGMHEDSSFILAQRIFHRRAGFMTQYYRLNDEISEYRIARVEHNIQPTPKASDSEIKELISTDEFEKFYGDGDATLVPYKSAWYIKHRYYEHPIYRYHVYGVHKRDGEKVIFVLRKVQIDGVSILRVVDYIGKAESIKDIGDKWDVLMHESDAEYMDFYCTGITDEQMGYIGFIKRERDDKNVIPNWFEPFEQKNIEITYATATRDDVIFCRGDADMDRPNWGYY